MNPFSNSNDETKYVVGIQFGLNETSAAICRIDSYSFPEDIDFTGTGTMAIPSLMYIETSDDGTENVYIGHDAVVRHERDGRGVYYERFMVLTNTNDERKNPSIVAMKLFMREVYKIICQRRSGELMEKGCIKKNHFVFLASPSQIQGMDDHILYYYTKIAIDAGLPIAEFDLDLTAIDIRHFLPFLNNSTKPKLLLKSVFPLQNAIDSNLYSLVGIVRKSFVAVCEKEVLRLPSVIFEYNYESIDMAYYMSDGSLCEKKYPANEFEIEEAIYNYLKEYHSVLGDGQNPDALKIIEQNYHDMKLHCLYRIRRALEEHYLYNSTGDLELRYKFKPRLNESTLDVEIPVEILNEQILLECIKKVEFIIEDFKRAIINNDTITAVVLSGEGSRRDYVWNLAKKAFGGDIRFFPSWSIPNGVASVGRNVVKFANNTSIISNQYINEIINLNYRIMEKKFIVPEKGKIEYVIGIDFGHGETSAAICRIDSNKDPEDIDMTGTGKKTIPSTLYVEKNEGEEDVYIGQDAIAKYGSGGKGSFHAYFKQSIEEYDEAKIPSIKVMRLFMSEVYKAICHKRAGELMEGDRIKQNHVVFIACPSQSQKWGGQAMQNYVRLALDAGLPIAGVTIEDKFSMSGIVRESRAAYIRMLQKEEASQKALKGILVIDYGSSTIDITYYKEGEKPIDKGYSIGASRVEQKIQDFLKEYHDDLDEDQNPDALKLIERDYPYMNTQCLYRIRTAKEVFYEQYSSANCIQVAYRFMPRLNAKKIDVEIPKETINNKILTKYIKEVESTFEDFRDKVINNNKVTLMVLTGGASRMDFVEASAKSVFGNDVVLLPPQDPSLTVSNGIATAGRADVKMYHLIQEISGNPSIMKPSLYSKVKSAMVDEITNKVINVLSSEYNTFKDGSYPYSYSDKNCTIKLLERNVKSAIDNINYKDALNNIYVNVLSNHINSSVSPVLRRYTQTYFPTFKVDTIRSFNAPSGLTLNVSSSQLSTLDSIVKESVNTIEEGFFEFVGKTLLNFVGVGFAGFAHAITNVMIGGIRLGQAVAGVEEKKRVDFLDSNDFKDMVSDVTISYRDDETNLEYEKREKVYTEFQNRESGYKNQIKNNIENHFPLEIRDIETPGYQLIQHYLFNEFNHIQMLIK